MNIGGALNVNMIDETATGLLHLRESQRICSTADGCFSSGASSAIDVNRAPSAMMVRKVRKRPLSVTFAPSRDGVPRYRLFPDQKIDSDAYSDCSESFGAPPQDLGSTSDWEDASMEDGGDRTWGGTCVTILGLGSPNYINMDDPLERSLIWYSPEDIESFKSSARTLAGWIKRSEAQRSKDRDSCQGEAELLGLLRGYRERFDRRSGGADLGEGLIRLGILPAELAHLDPIDVAEHRGLEFRVSFERQRNRFIALRAVVTYLGRLHRESEKRGEVLTEYPVGKISYVSNKVTRWARDLARKEGLDDFRQAYPHIVPKEEVLRQAALADIGESSTHQFPLKLKKRKCHENSSDDLSSMLSCEMSLSGTSTSDEVSLSSMRSNTSIQSSYIKVKPFFEAVVEEQATSEQDQEEQQQSQAQQEQPKRRRRRGPSFTKAFGKKKSSSKMT
uniref:Uncharacterized protein n=1 Tax=Odontella aurita TaxID=265563 RepID=A0A7S4HLA1_9STRA|mmetsp:Transcript_1184/g.3185  ORF Transcript_1184/g.3185 Transcript_1184/m.3185 type:complete len:447 (+) Transcript_1184:49-1389(+)